MINPAITVNKPAKGSIISSLFIESPHIVQSNINGSRKIRFNLIKNFAVAWGFLNEFLIHDPEKNGMIIRAHNTMNFI